MATQINQDEDILQPSEDGRLIYDRLFRNKMDFKTIRAAEESVKIIAATYSYFERLGDHAGQHHCEVMALTLRNRARWSGRREESKVFEQWLFNH